jgi:pimeloyl-ACP methyl ester carboxylesterase
MDDRGSWRADELGTAREVRTAGGTVRAFETGSGPPTVFVHGLLVNANLWRKVVPLLATDFRCVTLDLPLGSHELPMPAGADLSPPGLADLVADTVTELGLDDVTLVGNDTGGAISQLVVTRRSEHVGRLVLTSCDYRDVFPPAMFGYFKPAARVPGAIRALLQPMRLRLPRRLPIAYGWLAKYPIDREAEDSYVYPAMTSKEVETDLRRVIRGIDPRYTREAADRLGEFQRPALIAWSREDRFFKPEFAEGLARDLPNSRLAWVEDARTFSAEDNPKRLAELIAGFVREPAPARS